MPSIINCRGRGEDGAELSASGRHGQPSEEGPTAGCLSVPVTCSPSLGKPGIRRPLIGAVAEGLPAFNGHRRTFADVTGELESVPDGKANAAVRGALADLARIGCAVDASPTARSIRDRRGCWARAGD